MQGWWPALLLGVALAVCPQPACGAPDEPPEGFVWQDLKEIHSRLLKPTDWLYRSTGAGHSLELEFSPQPFDSEEGIRKGLRIRWIARVKALWPTSSADKLAAATITRFAANGKVLKGWTKEGKPSGPFTTYALVCVADSEPDGTPTMTEVVCVANRDTDTLYAFILTSPRAEWKDVEPWGETMLANLRLDPEF